MKISSQHITRHSWWKWRWLLWIPFCVSTKTWDANPSSFIDGTKLSSAKHFRELGPFKMITKDDRGGAKIALWNSKLWTSRNHIYKYRLGNNQKNDSNNKTIKIKAGVLQTANSPCFQCDHKGRNAVINNTSGKLLSSLGYHIAKIIKKNYKLDKSKKKRVLEKWKELNCFILFKRTMWGLWIEAKKSVSSKRTNHLNLQWTVTERSKFSKTPQKSSIKICAYHRYLGWRQKPLQVLVSLTADISQPTLLSVTRS